MAIVPVGFWGPRPRIPPPSPTIDLPLLSPQSRPLQLAYCDSDAAVYAPLGFWFMQPTSYAGASRMDMYVPRHGARLTVVEDDYFKVCGCSGRFHGWGMEEDVGLSSRRPDTEAERARSLNEYGNVGLRADAKDIDGYLGDLANSIDFENEDPRRLCYLRLKPPPSDKKSCAVRLSRMYLSLRYEMQRSGEYLPSIMTFILDYLIPTLLKERGMDEARIRRPEAVMYLLLNDLDERGYMDHGCSIRCGGVGESQKIPVLSEFRDAALTWARSAMG